MKLLTRAAVEFLLIDDDPAITKFLVTYLKQKNHTCEFLTEGFQTAAWLEYETRVPGQEPRRERRVLFDLPGPAARAAGLAAPPEIDDEKRVTRNLALMRQTEILPLGSVPDPAFVLHLAGQAAQALPYWQKVVGMATTYKDEPTLATARQRLSAPR